MNAQLAFAFGMLTMVALTMLVAIVIGLVKAVRQGKQIDTLNYNLSDFIARVERSPALDDLNREINLRIDSVEKHFTSQLDSRLDKLASSSNWSMKELQRMFNDYINNGKK